MVFLSLPIEPSPFRVLEAFSKSMSADMIPGIPDEILTDLAIALNTFPVFTTPFFFFYCIQC
jgi:hypothetical protein